MKNSNETTDGETQTVYKDEILSEEATYSRIEESQVGKTPATSMTLYKFQPVQNEKCLTPPPTKWWLEEWIVVWRRRQTHTDKENLLLTSWYYGARHASGGGTYLVLESI